MADKPSYLGLLNAIAVGECRGHALLECWSETTQDTVLKQTLKVVAIRENEHAAAFEKRLCELGYSVRQKPSEDFDRRMKVVASDVSDRQKFEDVLGYGKESRDDPLSEIFKDKTIDVATGELLGRFIAEERDSGRRLKDAYARTTAEAASTDSTLEDLSRRLDRLTRTIEELKGLRRVV